MKTALLLVLTAFVTSACGPGAAMDEPSLEGESDLATSADELGSSRADLWFPMNEGNSWTLQAASGATKTVSFNGVSGGVGQLGGLFTESRWVGASASAPNTLYSWSQTTNSWSAFLRFGYAVTGWSWGEGACGKFKVKRSATDLTLTTPAGTFSGARSISFTLEPAPNARCAAPAFSELTFAPNVGLIAISTYGEKFLLQSAKVKGQAIPSAAGVTGSLKLDEAVYVNSPNTIVCITTPCPGNEVTAVLKATYTLTNHGGTAQTWRFNSGCQFDLKLVDGAGQTVRSLSENRFCTLALTSFTLAPGQSKVYATELPLTTRAGAQLFGSYTARASLVPSSGAAVESAASFVVVKP